MIPKILPTRKNGKGISGVIEYNEKNASELLAVENFPEDDAKSFTEYLEFIAQQNKRIRLENTPFHVTLPFPPGEALDDQTYIDIARDYMQGMGYGEQPYAVFLHTDKAHLHLHIATSRVSAKNFRKIDDYNEKWRSLCTGAIIERKYGITDVLAEKLPEQLSRIVNGYFERQQAQPNLSIGAYFKNWRKLLNPHVLASVNRERMQRKPSPEVSNKILAQVNALVSDAMKEKPRSMAELKKTLEAQRVEVREVVSRQTGKRQGVVFVLHRENVKEPTIAAAERGIPSRQLPCFSEMPLMRQLYANRREYKAAQGYVRKQLVIALKRAKDREELQEILQHRGVLTTWHENTRGVYGVSFTYKGTTLKGVQVGKAFSYEKIAAILEKNSATAAAQVAIPQHQELPRHFGSIGGSGGGKNGEEDEDEELDETTGQVVKRSTKR
jgi:hypothetical protein